MNLIPPVYAGPAVPTPIGELCGEGLGPFAKFFCTLPTPNSTNPLDNTNTINATVTFAAFAYLISNIIGVLCVIAGIFFIIQFMLGGINWLTSGGDKAKLEKAQQGLVNAIIGLIIVLAAYAIISLIGKVLGFDLLLSNPGDFIDKIKFTP